LRDGDPSGYQISILHVVGSTATSEEVIAMEQLWKAKLHSREMA
jgi:hypothetical protein